MPSLIVVGKKDGAELALDSSVTVIGRDRGVTLELGDFQVSRRHALVVKTDDGTFVKCLGSRNGILVNSARVPSRRHQRLKNGDVLTVGRTALIYKDVVGPLDPAAVATIAARVAATAPAHPEKRAPLAAEKRPSPAAAAPAAAAPAAGASAAAPAPAPAAPVPAAGPVVASAARPRFVELAADAEGASGLSTGDNTAVRALLRRLEGERVFYRNLALALVTFLMILVLVLLVFTLRRHEKAGEQAGKTPTTAPADERVADATGSLPMNGGGGGGGGSLLRPSSPVQIALGTAGQLDEREFADTVNPLLARTCAAGNCHTSPVHGAGEFVLELGKDAGAVSRNLANVKRFVVPGRAERSALLTKPLRRDEGGEGHGGGDVLAAESPQYQTIRAWIARAAPPPGEAPAGPPGRGSSAEVGVELASPVGGESARTHQILAKIAPVAGSPAVGASIVLDGRASASSKQGHLSFHWTLTARPQGSKTDIAVADEGQARLVPDLGGSYVALLVVSDEDGSSSEPARVEVLAIGPAPAPVPVRVTLQQDANGRARVRALYVDLLGRGPTRDEAERALGRTREELVADVFAQEELYANLVEEELTALSLVDDARPAPDLVSELPGHLKKREATLGDTILTLATNQAFGQRYSSSDSFARAVATYLLGQEPLDASFVDAAKRMVDGTPTQLFGKTGRNGGDLVRIAIGQRAFLEQLARRSFQRVCGRGLEPNELEHALAKLSDVGPQGDLPATAAFFDLLREWVLSPRYFERGPVLRPKSERAYARTLFQDVLGRTPDLEELRSARRALHAVGDRAPLRVALAKVLLDSPQARVPLAGNDEGFARAEFEQLLAREPAPAELAAFVKALSSGTSRELAVRALVTSAEYSGY